MATPNFQPLPAHQHVNIFRTLPANTTPVTVPMTRDGGVVVAAQEGSLTGVGVDATINLEWDDGTWDTNIVGSALHMLSGDNAGYWRVVRTRTDNNDIITDPFPNSCAAGDKFYVDKPQMAVHEGWLKIATDTTGGDVCIAVGEGRVANAAYADVVPVEAADFIPLYRADGFTALSIYASADLHLFKYTMEGW